MTPRPALLSKFARFIADEAEVLLLLFYRRYSLARIERRAREPGADAHLLGVEETLVAEAPDALAVTASACKRALFCFFGECTFAGVGSFMYPGWGGYFGQGIGDLIGGSLL